METSKELPLTEAERTERIHMVWCGDCWAEPRQTCNPSTGTLINGFHQARVLRAIRKGLLPET